jgi:hypothetical protein
MSYKEIGELYIGEDLSTGIIKNRNASLTKKTLLYPDSERLLYNYTKEPHIRDMVYYTNGKDEKLLFIGKDVFIDYNANTGNFYCENPRYVLRSLCKPIAEGGLGLTQGDLFSVSENLQYSLLVGEWVYIVSKRVNGNIVLFKYNIVTQEMCNVSYEGFTATIGEAILLCKIFEYANELYFFTSKENSIKVYTYNLVTEEFYFHESISALANINAQSLIRPQMLTALIDKTLNWMFIITSLDAGGYKLYNFNTGEAKVVSSPSLNLAGKQIIYSGINQGNAIPNEGLFLVTDNNIVYFLSKSDSVVITTKVILQGSYGITNVVRYKNSSGAIQYLIFYTKIDGTQNFVLVSALSLYGADITINVLNITETEPLLNVFSDKINIAGFFFNEDAHFNLIYGSYEEAGVHRVLIKQLSHTTFNAVEHPFIIQGNLEKSSGIINVEGSAYGDMQLSRLHLRAENIDKEDQNPIEKDVFMRENIGDYTQYTTGSYLWKQLYKIGLPFNKHIETAGRIIIDGYDIPISKSYITRAKENNEYGDVLLTFDKYFNANTIKGALHENITQYPGALFFKNKGFLADAIISNSYEMEGTINYNDEANGDLFSIGVHSITASKMLKDGTLLVAGNYGCLASININTKGYTNIKGESVGDEPPPYYIPLPTIPNEQEPDNIKAIISWEDKIFILTNRGKLLKNHLHTNYWQEIENPDLSLTTNLVHYLNNRNIKAHTIKDNLLIISWPFGALSSFDLDSEIYTPVTHGNVFSNTSSPYGTISSKTITGNSLTINNKIYFVGGTTEITGKTLCWFDINSKSFCFAEGECNLFASRTKDRVDLTTDGTDIYLLFSQDNTSTLVKYDITLDTFTTLNATPFKHSRCGIYYYNNCIYALFGIDGNNNKYIQIYYLATKSWMSYKVSNNNLPVIYDAKSFIQKGINNNLPFTKINLFWGISKDVKPGEVEFSNIIEIELQNIVNIQDSVSIGFNLDTIFSSLRFIGYSLEYDSTRNEVYVVNGLISGSNEISKKVYRINFNTKNIIFSYDKEISHGSFYNVSGLVNHYLYNIGGFINTAYSTEENIDILSIRDGIWSEVKSLAYNPGTNLIEGKVPIITSMKVIYPGNMLVISYMDGGIGSFDLRTGRMILPTNTDRISLNCIHALPGAYASSGAYNIYEDDEDVNFICVNHEFKFAKHIGAFFKKNPSDSTRLTITTKSKRPYPLTGSSQVSIGKYIVFLNGYDYKEANWQETLHNNIVALDTSTGEYATLGINNLSKYRYNAFSYYYNGYIYTFGGIQRYTRYESTVVEYERRAVIERYDLVTGQAIVLPTTYGVELNESVDGMIGGIELDDSAKSKIGRNQIIQLTPYSCNGEREDNTILASIILANDNEANNHLIRKMFLFDLVSETEYTDVDIPEITFGNNGAVLLCERKSTKELYAFQFHTELNAPIVDRNEYCELSIFKYIFSGGVATKDEVVSRFPIRSPLKYQNYITGLCEIIYNEDTDTFVIPALARNLPTMSDKKYLAVTIGYEFNPMLNTLKEIIRESNNLVKLMENECSLPVNNATLGNQLQCNSTSLLKIHAINDKYILVNPTSEVMAKYSKEELFRQKTPFNDNMYDEWSDEDKSLYTLFNYKEDAFEVAPNVKPGMDNFIHKSGDVILRPIVITHGSSLIPLLKQISIQEPDANQSLFMIIGLDLNLRKYSVLHSEIIEINSHSYSVASGLINGILWSFLNYNDENASCSQIISYEINTKGIGHHGFSRVLGDEYNISSEYDLPRCIINEEKGIIYIILINRAQLSHSFTGVVYGFFGLDYTAHITDVIISKTVSIFNTFLQDGNSYYKTLAINCNGYVFSNNLFIDIFNGENGEISYSVDVPLNTQGFITQNEIKVKHLNRYCRSRSLLDTTYVNTFRNGVIQDICGYDIRTENNKKIVCPIIAIDSSDILIDSSYKKTRSYILFDNLNSEIPKALVSFIFNENKADVFLNNEEDLLCLIKESDGMVYLIQNKKIDADRYFNIKDNGRLPVPPSSENNKIIVTKSVEIDNNKLLSVFSSGNENGVLPYIFNTKNKIYSFASSLAYGLKQYIDGDIVLIEHELYCIGRNKLNSNYITLQKYDMPSGILLNTQSLLGAEIKGIKVIYNSLEKNIYLFGGTVVSTNLPNIIVYTYNIDTGIVNTYFSASLLNGEIVNAYYYEDFNKTFIQLKTASGSTGKLLILNHDTNTLYPCTNQNNPITTERMIKTKNGALVYINKDFSLQGGAHYVFDPVTFNYIGIAANDISGPPMANEVPSEIIPVENKNIFMGIKTQNDDNFQWVTGPLFFANAGYSPIDLLATKRLFVFDGDIYLYGKDSQHEIHKYNSKTKTFDLYDNNIHDLADIADSSYFTSKVYLDGKVRFCFINPSYNQNEIKVTLVLYDIIGKRVISVNNISVIVSPTVSNVYSSLDLSIKPVWVSHYMLFVLPSPNHAENFIIKIDLLTNLATAYLCHNAINAKSILEWYYDRIISLGGHSPGNADVNYDIASFRIADNNIEPTIKKFTLPVTHDGKKKSLFISAKSAKKLSGLYLNHLIDDGLNKSAIINYDDTNIDMIMANLTSAGGNGSVNGNAYTAYIEKQYLPNDLTNALQIALFESKDYLTDERIVPYQIPYKDDQLFVGVYDKLIYPNPVSQLSNYEYTTKLRVAHLNPDLIAVHSSYDYLVYFYSGITKDTIETFNKYTREKISSVSFERDYGVVITEIEPLDNDKFIIIYDNNPAVGTTIIHEDGNITVKRYDGSIFGRPIDPGTNNHTLQEVDLTFLFDCESSEYDIRKEII